MAVRKRNGVFYVDFRYNNPNTGQRQRFKRSTGRGTTKRRAEELERTWRREVETVTVHRKETKTAVFSGFMKYFLEVHIITNCKPSYQRTTEQIIRCHLVPFFGHGNVRHIEVEDVERYKALKAKTLAPKDGEQPSRGVVGRVQSRRRLGLRRRQPGRPGSFATAAPTGVSVLGPPTIRDLFTRCRQGGAGLVPLLPHRAPNRDAPG